jgi:hypothetical protein
LEYYQVRWRIKETGYEGQSEPLFTKEDCQRFCDKANIDFPNQYHWPVLAVKTQEAAQK